MSLMSPIGMRQPAGLACYVTDANWRKTLMAAPLDHGSPNFGMQDYWDKVEKDMDAAIPGQKNTVTIANLAERTQMSGSVFCANTLEELADLLEVMMAVAEARGHDFAEVEAIRKAKANKRGGFRERIFLESVTEKGE